MSEKAKHTGSYDAATIEKYLSGKLSPAEMHALEKAALDDPFLADAIEGMTQGLQSRSSLSTDVNELRERLKQRIGDRRSRKVISISYKNWWQIAAIFATVLFCGIAAYYVVTNNRTTKNEIAKEPAHAQPATTDSARTNTTAPTPTVKDTIVMINPAETKAPEKNELVSKRKNTKKTDSKKDTVYNEIAANQVAKETDERRLKPQSAPDAAENQDKASAKSSKNESFVVPSAQNSFMGKVMDENKKPIASAHIEVPDKKIAAVTDNNGNFKLNIKDRDSVVEARVNSVGYESELSDLSNNGSPNVIVLRQQKSGLQEVVTTRANSAKQRSGVQKTTQDAAPVHGWDEYNKYLEKNRKAFNDSIGLKGPVVVSFSVNKKGKLSNFMIEQSLGPDYDEEAIRMIKEGPAWKLLKGKQATVNVIVTF